MVAESYSVAAASRLLGVSIPTLKSMCAGGQLACFRTPGGQLRVSADALAAIRSDGRPRASVSSAPSSVLQARRERVEELNLEGQELRAQRQLESLRAEQAAEIERRAAAERERQAEREEGRAQSRTERERQERELAQQQVELRRAELRQRFLSAAAASLPSRLSVARSEQLLDALEAELIRRGVEDDGGVALAVSIVTPRIVSSWRTQDRTVRQREDAERRAVREVRWAPDSTEAEKSEAITAVRATLATLPITASEEELRVAAFSAVAPILEKLNQRRERERRIGEGVAEVFPYLERLRRAGGISGGPFDVLVLRLELEDGVRRHLSAHLRNEGHDGVCRLVHEFVDSEVEQQGVG